MKHRLTIIQRTALVVLLAMTAQLLSAQITIAQWNGYTPAEPYPTQFFLATNGTSLNNGIAELKRDFTVVQNSDYAVFSDGIAATTFWNNTVADPSSEKYWIATFNTTGYENLTVTSKQIGTNSGPKDFKLQYRVGNGAWADVTGGTIEVANDSYITGVLTDLVLPAAMEDQTSVSLRWLRTSTTSVNGGTISATNGRNRLNVVVKGDAKEGVVDPKITTNSNVLKFFTQNQEVTFTVTAENLTGSIAVASSNPSLFLVDPSSSSLPANASDAVVKVMFSGTTNATATLTLTSGALVKTITLTAIYMPSGNNGTEEKPFTISESKRVQGAAGNTDYYWVKGYIVGVSDGGASFTPVFNAPFSVNTNLLLSSDPDERALEDILPIQLINNFVREELNLRDNATNLGQYVKIEGTLEPYFGREGLRTAVAYEFINASSNVKNTHSSSANVYFSNGTLHIENIENSNEISIQIYDVTGKLILSTQKTEIPLNKGFYVVKVNSQTFKVINN